MRTVLAVAAFAAWSVHRAAAAAPLTASETGASIVQQHGCAGCHGAQLRGGMAPSLVGIEHRRTPAQIANAIAHPVAPMPNFGLSSAQVGDVVAYLSQLDGGTAGRPAVSISPAKPSSYAIVTVTFPGEMPADAAVRATMEMGSSAMSTPKIPLKKGRGNTASAKLPFSMGGPWMVHVTYDKTKHVDVPLNVAGGM